jgi:hypothetical protein
VGEAIYGTLSEHEKLLLNHLNERSLISITDAVRLTGKDWHACRDMAEKMVAGKNLMRRQSSNAPRNGAKRYVLRKKCGSSG